MGNVHGHADFVHALDDSHAEIREPFIAAFGGAVANQVAGIVGKLRDALAEVEEIIDIIGIFLLESVLSKEEARLREKQMGRLYRQSPDVVGIPPPRQGSV